MNIAQAMTREELLEYAALDAFGLLDEYDADRFTRAFNNQPITVQEELRRMQAEISVDPSLLIVDEEPSPALRERVLAAVAAAIDREESQLAPLASIGRNRSIELAAHRRPWFASAGLFWRAACFVLAAGCVLMAFQWSAAVREGNTIAKLALNNLTDRQLQELIGPDFEAFLKTSRSNALALRPVDSSFPGQATIFRNEENGSAFIMATLVPVQPGNQPYTVRVKGQQPDLEPVATFVSNGTVVGVRIENIPLSTLASTSWEIVNAAGAVVLSSDLMARG